MTIGLRLTTCLGAFLFIVFRCGPLRGRRVGVVAAGAAALRGRPLGERIVAGPGVTLRDAGLRPLLIVAVGGFRVLDDLGFLSGAFFRTTGEQM